MLKLSSELACSKTLEFSFGLFGVRGGLFVGLIAEILLGENGDERVLSSESGDKNEGDAIAGEGDNVFDI